MGLISDRSDIRALLTGGVTPDIGALIELYRREGHAVIRHLISLSYDKGGSLSIRAIEAVGVLSGQMSAERARGLIQRILWMMRDESGGTAWSGPELIGAIVSENPALFEDIVPVLFSFHEEEIFTAGVLWAMARIARRRPDFVMPLSGEIARYLEHHDASVRENAQAALDCLRLS